MSHAALATVLRTFPFVPHSGAKPLPRGCGWAASLSTTCTPVPLSRAAKLAAFCGYPDAERDERLKEMNMGHWEMQRFDDIIDERLQLWYDDFLNQPTTGGESFRDLYARVAAFLNELRKKDYRRVAVFAHGGVLICAQVYAGAIPLEDGFKHLTSYGGVVKINI